MGVFDALSRLLGGRSSEDSVARSACRDLASRARGETVTADVLANRSDRSNDPLIEYIGDDELPHHVFLGNEVVVDNDDSYTTEYPARHTQFVITDRRLLVLLGNRITDTVWEVPLEDVLDVYVDDESWKQYLIVEADRNDQRMTFFVDVTMESETDELRSGVEFVRERAQ